MATVDLLLPETWDEDNNGIVINLSANEAKEFVGWLQNTNWNLKYESHRLMAKLAIETVEALDSVGMWQ